MSRTRKTVIWVVVAAVVVFIVFALSRSAPRPQSAEPVAPDSVPARVYGRLEPLGGEVFVSAPLSREVTAIRAQQGDRVNAGDVVVRLEQSVENAAAQAAEAQVRAAGTAFELSRDARERNRVLFDKQGISDYEFRQFRLQAELDSLNLVAAQRRAEQAQAALELLTLRAPVDGLVYKLDLRLGQTLLAGDNTSIILGRPGYQARLYVESFWLGRVEEGTSLVLRDAESLDEIGRATVVRKAPYLGTRQVRTEDNRVRLDVEVQEVIAELDEPGGDLPIGLYVLAELGEGE
jgi:membrane fusion protein (multidrug efflux system)